MACRLNLTMWTAICLLICVRTLAAQDAFCTVQIGGRDYQIPQGFVLQQIAGSDLVPRPIVADFDDQGDLFVADSSGSNDDVQTQLREQPHRILRLRDTDGDGVFDERTVFVDRIMFPEGVMSHQDAVYVAAPPHIWKFSDLDGDGVADRREIWLDGQTLTGCANDLHGPYLGNDGWIYWCKGAFAEQTYTLPTGRRWTTRAAHIFRRRVEGGPVEPVMTGGMDNPVDVVFTAAGERIFTTTFLQHPAGGQRDGLIHAIYGGVYGKSHGVLEGHPRTGDLMPVLRHLGPAAPCGLTRLEGDLLGGEFDGNLLSCAFNLHQVTRHQLQADEATFRSDDSVLLASPDLDFHPTDVLQDADGSIVVIDTGGWYKLCCPTSQLHKPDVLGGIYRLRREGTNSTRDPRGNGLDWEGISPQTLATRLGDPRHVVRKRAQRQLVARGAEALSVLRATFSQVSDVRTRREFIWTACQIEHPAATEVLRWGLGDADGSVRQASLHAISVRRESELAEPVQQCLTDPDPAVRRVAAEAVGRLGFEAAIPTLLSQMQYASDRVLEHSLIYALIEIGNASALQAAWPQADAAARRAILMAVDQIPGADLNRQQVLDTLAAPDARSRQTALWVISRHPEWAAWLTESVLGRLAALAHQPAVASEVGGLLAQFLNDPQVQRQIANSLDADETDAVTRHILLDAVGKYTGEQLSDLLQQALVGRLSTEGVEWMEATIAALGAHPRKLTNAACVTQIRSVANLAGLDQRLRLQAIGVLRGTEVALPQDLFEMALRTVSDEEEFELRRLASEALSGSKLTAAQLRQLVDGLPNVGPVELGQLLMSLKQTRDSELAALALVRLTENDGLVVVPDSRLREAFEHFDENTRRGLEQLLQSRVAGQTNQAERLRDLLDRLPNGDIRRGQQVFHSSKAACFACHAMGYRGGDIGPDLTRIGQIRSRQDLLEAIVYPSASFVRSYEPLSVMTKSGLTVQGVIKDENNERLLLINDQREPVEIARADIELAEPGRVSVMPSGLDQLLTETELADLIAFLEAAR